MLKEILQLRPVGMLYQIQVWMVKHSARSECSTTIINAFLLATLSPRPVNQDYGGYIIPLVHKAKFHNIPNSLTRENIAFCLRLTKSRHNFRREICTGTISVDGNCTGTISVENCTGMNSIDIRSTRFLPVQFPSTEIIPVQISRRKLCLLLVNLNQNGESTT